MVTVKRVPRLRAEKMNNESFVERYIRAKRRQEVRPVCLFDEPSRAETDEFLLQLEIAQMKETKKVYEKYDLSEIPDGAEKDDIFPKFDTANDDKREDKKVESNAKFQPKVLTEQDRPPGNNVFVPIDIAEPTLSEYWQTSKRRRSSNSKDHSTSEDDAEATKDTGGDPLD